MISETHSDFQLITSECLKWFYLLSFFIFNIASWLFFHYYKKTLINCLYQ